MKPRRMQQHNNLILTSSKSSVLGITNPNCNCPKAYKLVGYKEVFHSCAIETMHIITFLFVVTQSLTTHIWCGHMDAAFVGAIMSTNFKIEELSMSARRTSCIPNHYICRGP